MKINIGKIDYNRTNRRINMVELDITIIWKEINSVDTHLNKINGYWAFSASASVWNSKHTDILIGGQCLEEILPYLRNNKSYIELVKYWRKYHLNDLTAGTYRQQLALAHEWYDYSEYDRFGFKSSYEFMCSVLRDAGLYEDSGYIYGSAWLVDVIPQNEVDDIKRIIKELSNGKHK